MSVEYYYMNDLNTLYNASVGDKTDGGEHHMKMMVAHDNLEAYMQKMEHWRDTALQLSRNNGEAQAKINALEADYIISNRELLVKQVEIQRLTARIAELEGKFDQLTARWRQERQDDKSSNDTQTQTIHGEDVCPKCHGTRLIGYDDCSGADCQDCGYFISEDEMRRRNESKI